MTFIPASPVRRRRSCRRSPCEIGPRVDTVTHTLVGLGLAEAGLKRRTRLAVPALAIEAPTSPTRRRPGDGVGPGRCRRLPPLGRVTHGLWRWRSLPLVMHAVLARIGRDPDSGDARGQPRLDRHALLGLCYLAVATTPILKLAQQLRHCAG